MSRDDIYTSHVLRAPRFPRHGGRAWGSPGERSRPSEITDLDARMHPSIDVLETSSLGKRGNRELSADPRWLSVPPLYLVHIYRLAETYTTDQPLAKGVSSKQ